MTEETKVIFTDGACKFNNEKDVSKRKMYWCFVDSSRKDIPNNPYGRNWFMGTALNVQKNYKLASNNIAELLALYEALKYCINPIRKYEDVLIKMDSKTIYLWVQSGKVGKKINGPEFTQSLLDKVTVLKSQIPNISLEVLPREDNLAGHRLEELT